LPEWFANKHMMRPPDAPDYATGHAIENNLAMASALDMKPVTQRLALVINGFSAVEADKRIVLIHPGASRAQKQWPLEYWKQIVESPTLRNSTKIILTGNPAERGLTDALARMTSVSTENLAGKLSLRELALLQKKAALFLSGDTGPYHMAVAMGCPTVTLFAPTDRGSSIEACGPHKADPEKHIALQTRQYGDSISTITAGEVLQVVAKILAGSRP
jgi:ADP-heptose:LPS heptosyltransferase